MFIAVTWNLLQVFLKYDTWSFHRQDLHVGGTSHMHVLKGRVAEGTCKEGNSLGQVPAGVASALVLVMNLAVLWGLPTVMAAPWEGLGCGKGSCCWGQRRSTPSHIFHPLSPDTRNNRFCSPECTTGTSPMVFLFLSCGRSSPDLARNNLLSSWHQNSILPKLLRWCELSLLNGSYENIVCFACVGTESLFLKGTANRKIIAKTELHHEQNWRNAECLQSYTPLAHTQVIFSQVMACSAG